MTSTCVSSRSPFYFLNSLKAHVGKCDVADTMSLGRLNVFNEISYKI